MEELIALLKTDTSKALAQLTAEQKDFSEIAKLRKEFEDIDRNFRETQIGRVQKGKYKGKGKDREWVEAVKIPIPLINKITRTATAFEVGEDITRTPETINDLSDEIDLLWKTNRLDSILRKAKFLQKSQLHCAILFYIKDIPQKSYNRPKGAAEKKQIKAKILEDKNGRMVPYFDAYDDMLAFTWEFTENITAEKKIKHSWVYDDTYIHKCKEVDGKMTYQDSELHGFERIPIVYLSQDKPEWHIAQPMIDRLEVTLSKLGAANDYTAHPILLLYGKVEGAPGKDEDGKALSFPVTVDEDGREHHGDAKYLVRENAAESTKLELEQIDKYIHSITSTPDISFENMKSIGALSGIAIKLMFLDAMIKSKMNEGENTTIVERMINIMIDGTVNTTATKLRNLAESTIIDITFNSILPNDVGETIDNYVAAVNAGIMSVETAVKKLDEAEDIEEEIKVLKEQADKKREPVVTS